MSGRRSPPRGGTENPVPDLCGTFAGGAGDGEGCGENNRQLQRGDHPDLVARTDHPWISHGAVDDL